MNNNPVFIHALFKTGSTYVWLKFRNNDQYCCYYEPFHHFLLEIDHNFETRFIKENTIVGKIAANRKHYLYEYKKLLENGKKGLPFFNKSFVFDIYCDNNDHPEIKEYVDFLLSNAGDKKPVLQFNRTALRIKWFKQNYKNALQIYLVRNPRDQWESYIRKAATGKTIFVIMDLMISSLNLESDYFNDLRNNIPFIQFNHNDFHREKAFYEAINYAYSNQEKYFIFYYIWLVSLIENVLYADIIININLLSYDLNYKKLVNELFKNHDVIGVDFDDAHIRQYTKFTLNAEHMKNIEYKVQQSIFKSLSKDKLTKFFNKFSNHDKKYFSIYHENLQTIANSCIECSDIQTKIVQKYKDIIFLIFDELIKSKNSIHEKEKKIVALSGLANLKSMQIDSIYNSYTYKVGKIITYPIKALKKLVIRSQ